MAYDLQLTSRKPGAVQVEQVQTGCGARINGTYPTVATLRDLHAYLNV